MDLNFKKKRNSFTEISINLVNFGDATRTVMGMAQLKWYLTDKNYLVCGANGNSDLENVDTIKLILVVDENLAWLAKRTQRVHWDNFGTPVHIAKNELDHYSCIILLEESKEEEISNT